MIDTLLVELGVDKNIFQEILAFEKVIKKFNAQKKIV